jgi:hypothetical protein
MTFNLSTAIPPHIGVNRGAGLQRPRGDTFLGYRRQVVGRVNGLDRI